MLLNKHKFIVEKVGNVEQSKTGGHKFVNIILMKPGYTNEFGDKVGPDDIFSCTAWNKTITELPALNKGDKVEALLVLQGREQFDRNNSKTYYSTGLVIRNIVKL
jgi:hypothetical protein